MFLLHTATYFLNLILHLVFPFFPSFPSEQALQLSVLGSWDGDYNWNLSIMATWKWREGTEEWRVSFVCSDGEM